MKNTQSFRRTAVKKMGPDQSEVHILGSGRGRLKRIKRGKLRRVDNS